MRRDKGIDFQGTEKNFKINFAGVVNNATFAVPNKTGEYQKADGAMLNAIQDEDLRPGNWKKI